MQIANLVKLSLRAKSGTSHLVIVNCNIISTTITIYLVQAVKKCVTNHKITNLQWNKPTKRICGNSRYYFSISFHLIFVIKKEMNMHHNSNGKHTFQYFYCFNRFTCKFFISLMLNYNNNNFEVTQVFRTLLSNLFFYQAIMKARLCKKFTN